MFVNASYRPETAPVRLLDRCTLDQPVARFALPAALAEVSGLTLGPDGEVWAHGDEVGSVVALDARTGVVSRETPLADRPRDDFEGIAATPAGIVVMSSNGILYLLEGEEDDKDDGKAGSVGFRRIDTGLGRACELEGLAWDGAAGVLLLPCKVARDPRYEGQLVLHRWDLDRSRPADPPTILLPPDVLGRLSPGGRFRATSVEWDSVTGRILVLSASPQAILELDSQGAALTVTPLDPSRHPQPEGLTLVGDRLLIADEGGQGTGTLTAYTCDQ